MNKITWVQLSDLHILDSTEWNVMKNKYISILKQSNVQFIIVSGDLHNIDSTYSKTIEFLNDLITSLGISKKDIFIIPGNHDCDKDSKIITEEIAAFISSNIDMDSEIYTTRKERLLQKYTEYKSFLLNFYGNDLYKEQEKIIDGCNVFLWNNTINILCINSTLICDGHRTHKQILGTKKLSELSVNKNYPLIACMHHTHDDIFNIHRNYLNAILKNINTSVLMCGDKHLANVEDNTNNYPNNFCCPCITCYKSSVDPRDRYSEFGFIIYTWDLKEQYVSYEFFKWNQDILNFKPDDRFDPYESLPSFPMKRGAKNEISKKESKKESKAKKTVFKSGENIPTLWSVTGEILIEKVKNADLSKTNHLLKNMQNVLVDTEESSVLSFLQNNTLSFSYLLGLKGNGKTLCITLKRYMLQKNGVICIPKNEVLSKNGYFNITTELLSGINTEFETLTSIKEFIYKISSYWQLAIYLTILQAAHELENAKDSFNSCEDNHYFEKVILTVPTECRYDMKQIFDNKTAYSPIEFMMLVLDWSDESVNILNRQMKPVTRLISKRLRESNTHLAIFIDAIDQMRFHCNRKIPEYLVSRMDQIFQIALLLNYDLFNPNIAMYFTMRQEVFIAFLNDYKFKNTENINGEIILSYSKVNIESLYKKYIFNDNPKYRYIAEIPQEYKNDTDKLSESFVGTNEIYNKNKQCKETLFNYLYRHTFRRARDLTKLCEKLALNIESIRLSNNNSVSVKEIIDNYIRSDNFGYLMEYVSELYNESDCFGLFDEKFLSLIPSDILSYDHLNLLRKKYKDLYQNESLLDPFEVLYRLGLIGYFEENEQNDYVHKLIPVTSIRAISERRTIDSLLPSNAEIFTIHTVLSRLISIYRKKFYYSRALVINTNETISLEVYQKIKQEINNINID